MPDPPQTEAETMTPEQVIEQLRAAVVDCEGERAAFIAEAKAEGFDRPCDICALNQAAIDALTTALRERDEARDTLTALRVLHHAQTEAETLISRLREMADRYVGGSQSYELLYLLREAAEALTTALRERDEARLRLELAERKIRIELPAAEQACEAAERERDEAKRVIANLRESLDMAHEQMRELDDLQAGQQDQITTLRALMQRLAEMDPAGEDGSWRCFFCSELLASQAEYGGEIIEHPHDPSCPWLKATRLASDLESRS